MIGREIRQKALELTEGMRLKLSPRVSLDLVPGATIESAKLFEQGGRWREAAAHYYSVFAYADMTQHPEQALQAFSSTAQMLLNCGAWGQMLGFLREGVGIVDANLISNRRMYDAGAAVYQEERGWLAEDIGNPEAAINWFSSAKGLVESIGQKDRTVLEEQILSTSTHFLGRALRASAGFAKRPIDRLRESISFLRQDLAYFENLKSEGDFKPENIGFQHAHLMRVRFQLAREYQRLGLKTEVGQQLIEAYKNHDEAIKHFLLFQETHPQSTIKAHAELIEGYYDLEMGSPHEARRHFLAALGIRAAALRSGVEPYPTGFVDAALASSKAEFITLKYPQALGHLAQAISVHPGYTLTRLLAGG